MKLDPITWAVVALALVGGGAAGYVLGGGGADDSAEVAQAVAELSEAVSRPLTLDAETRAGLANDMPAGCLTPELSITPACLAAACWRFQQSDAGRSDAKSCAELVDDARIQSWIAVCSTGDNDAPNWVCVGKAIEAAREQD